MSNDDGEILYRRSRLPQFIQNPSGEYVLKEMVHQSVWSMFLDGWLRLLASTRPTGVPMFMYVGTSSVITHTAASGQVVYLDSQGVGPNKHTIVADSIAIRRRFALPGRPIGISEYEPARTLLNTALNAQDAIDRFFGNNMFLDLLFFHDGDYVKNAGKQLLEQLAKRHAGPKRAFRPIVTDRKWKIERLRESNQANQLLEIWMTVNAKVCTEVFGIDPLVFSVSNQNVSSTSLTYQNAASLRSQVWHQAIEPVASLIADCITDYLPTGEHFLFAAQDFLRGSPSDRASLMEKMALVGKHYGKVMFAEEEIREVGGFTGPAPASPRVEVTP